MQTDNFFLQFIDRFIDDATELISDLENNMLILENQPENHEKIEEIFRTMHTIKGTASMYGLEKIQTLTHNMESIYEDIRSSKSRLSTEIFNITLEAIDFLKLLLNTKEDISENQALYFETLINKINSIQNNNLTENFSDNSVTAQSNENEEVTTFFVTIKPNQNTFRRGINPLSIIEEINENSVEIKTFSITENVPDIDEINTKLNYCAWHCFVVANSKELINDACMFLYDEEYEIHTLSNNNLLSKNIFTEFIENNYFQTSQLSIEVIQNFLVEHLEIQQIIENEVSEKKYFENVTEKNIQIVEKHDIVTFEETSKKDRQITSIRVTAENLDILMNLVSELITSNAQLSLISNKLANDELTKAVENVTKLSKRFRENALELRLVPLESIIVRFHRLVRDLSLELNKEVEFIVEGEDTKLDKSIISGLESPLMHIIRNSIDHGIENKETRQKLGKSEKGLLRFIAFYSGSYVFIQIQDDGSGINLEKVKETAIKKGYIGKDEVLDNKEIMQLILQPGFTTADKISSVSGRGVGLDVVKKQIGELRGEIEIETEKNLGTSITLKLPLTLSIIDALLVKISESFFLIPLNVIYNCQITNNNLLLHQECKQIEYEDELIPFIYLRETFGIEGTPQKKEKIVIIKTDDKKVALIVDKVIGEYQAVLKPLGDFFEELEFLSGASILGDGNLALIIDTTKLVKLFSNENTISGTSQY